MRTVYWNKLAVSDYFANIDYLLREWSEKEAQRFIDEVEDTVYVLSQENIDFQNTDFQGVKRCPVCKQISLFYRITDQGGIELLRFWNNFQDDKKLNI